MADSWINQKARVRRQKAKRVMVSSCAASSPILPSARETLYARLSTTFFVLEDIRERKESNLISAFISRILMFFLCHLIPVLSTQIWWHFKKNKIQIHWKLLHLLAFICFTVCEVPISDRCKRISLREMNSLCVVMQKAESPELEINLCCESNMAA